MKRTLFFNRVRFGKQTCLVQSYIDSWGEDDVVVQHIAAGDGWELEPMTYWLAMCSIANRGEIVIDCGAYTGIFSLFACSLNKELRVVAVEASSVTYGRLVSNIYLNQLETRIIPCHNAIYDNRQTVELSHMYGLFTMASGETVEVTTPPDHREIVPSISLDSLLGLDENVKISAVRSKALGLSFKEAVCALKVDAEGAEEIILENSVKTLQAHRPFILVEMLQKEKRIRIEKSLSDMGYVMAAELPGCNFVFAHESKQGLLDLKVQLIRESISGGFELDRLIALLPGDINPV